MANEAKHLLVIGAASIDTKGRADQSIQTGTSTPGAIRISLGGVARNIAENLARLGEEVILLSAVGDDDAGRQILAEATQCGIDVSQVLVDADPYDQKWRDPILMTPKLDALQEAMESGSTKDVLMAVGKAEDVGIPKEAGTGAISLAIGFIDRVRTAKEFIDRIIGEAENILTSEGIGGWRLVK